MNTMLLDIAGYGLFENAGNVLSTIGNVLLGLVGIAVGGIALLWVTLLGIVAIVAVSYKRGVNNRSFPKAVGAFFRLSGVLTGALLAIIFLPFALLFKLSTASILITVAIMLLLGFLVGRTISKLIGLKLRQYGYYARAADTVRGRIMRVIHSV